MTIKTTETTRYAVKNTDGTLWGDFDSSDAAAGAIADAANFGGDVEADVIEVSITVNSDGTGDVGVDGVWAGNFEWTDTTDAVGAMDIGDEMWSAVDDAITESGLTVS